MLLGVPREVKESEHRVALTPDKVGTLVGEGHRVVVERGAGAGAGFRDREYVRAGAHLTRDHAEAFGADMVVKVKEPQPQEYRLFRPGLVLFTYLHLAASRQQTQELLASRVTGIAYETVQTLEGSLPLLVPMSEIAGRLSPQIAAHHLQSTLGGPGLLLSGVPGVRPATVVVLGGGTVGRNAAAIALGMGARVVLLDRNLERMRTLHATLGGNLQTLYSNRTNLAEVLQEADAVIGAVLVPGAAAPKVVTREMLRGMRKGSVLVDVSIDQGGCFETSRPTTHSDPTYTVDGVIHYAVTNIPSLVARTASFALSNAIFPYVALVASLGLRQALQQESSLARGVNTYNGRLTHPVVTQALGMEYSPLDRVMEHGAGHGTLEGVAG